jgi:hypothetical protein
MDAGCARVTPLTLLLCASLGEAQIVRGVVTERDRAIPISGAVVALEKAGEVSGRTQSLRSVLTNERGEYAIRAPASGLYRLTAKRIGVKRFVSDTFALADGETRVTDVTLDAVLFTLPEVTVSVSALCAARPNQARRLASLWDEARTALTATEISRRDRLFNARLVRYIRELDPRTLRVISESRASEQGMTDRPFRSLSADSLSRVGYWRELRGNVLEYYGPDAEVLMSEAFLRDHCFTVVDGGRERPGFVGLAFEPVKNRRLPDVRGTIWLDGRSFQLQLLDFQYTQIPAAQYAERVGGQVYFARMPSGAWVVRRWFIRMPQYARYAVGASLGLRNPSEVQGPTIARLVEEGGDVLADGLRLFEKPASLAGVVSDSASAALSGASVRLAGTSFNAPVDGRGAFRLDSLPPGRYTLVVAHEAYRTLGMTVAEQEVTLDEGNTHRVDIRAPDSETIVRRLCEGRKPARDHATLHVTMLDSASGAPLSGVRARLSWKEFDKPTQNQLRMLPRVLEATIDARGMVTFCDLPSGTPLELAIALDAVRSRPLSEFRLAAKTVIAQTLLTSRPR